MTNKIVTKYKSTKEEFTILQKVKNSSVLELHDKKGFVGVFTISDLIKIVGAN